MESQAGESCEDVRKSGYLRKQKSMHRRYFVLRAASERGPARLEYYESEKKFRGKAPVPKKAVALETCFNINKRADSKNKHMIVLYTRAESFAIAAENEADQDEWYQAMVDLQCKSKRDTHRTRTLARMHALHTHSQCCMRRNVAVSAEAHCRHVSLRYFGSYMQRLFFFKNPALPVYRVLIFVVFIFILHFRQLFTSGL